MENKPYPEYPQPIKVLVGMCCGGTVKAETVTCTVAVLNNLASHGIPATLSIQCGGYKPHNMNRLVRELLANKEYTHFLSVDADMTFPAHGALRLLDADKDIIGANYRVRGNGVTGDPSQSVIKVANKDGKRIAINEIPTQLFRCWALGLGFTLFKREVFENKDITAPWFEEKENPEGDHSTEDVVFCERAQSAGFEVWCHPDIPMGHLGLYKY